MEKILNIATDCSGIETILMAMDEMWIKYNHILSSEINNHAIHFINNNFKPDKLYLDLVKRDNTQITKNIDIYCAGFPCQSFSALGKHMGFKDEKRGMLFFNILDFIKTVSPTVFILENVKTLLFNDNGNTFKTIMKHLNSLEEYEIQHEVLNTLDYGIPQSRNRLYIIGIKKVHVKNEFVFPKKIQTLPISQFIDETNIGDGSELTDRQTKMLRDIKIQYPKKDRIINLNISSLKWSRRGIVGISPCLLTNCDYFIVHLNRKFTPAEALGLQGVPYAKYDWSGISDRQQFKLAGNAMSVNVLKCLLQEIFASVSFDTITNGLN